MVTTIDMMKARERRANIQNEMISKYNLPIVYFSMNIPGPIKTNDLFRYAFNQGKEKLLAQLELEKIEIVYQDTVYDFTGDEFYAVCNSDALTLKRIGTYLEEIDYIGRIFDVDIINTNGLKIDRSELGLQPRKCLICDNLAIICARSRAHTVDEMISNIIYRIEKYKEEEFKNSSVSIALKALLYEVSITPKPGLIDRNDNGSHKDMDYFSFVDSSISLSSSLRKFVELGIKTKEINLNTVYLLKGIGKESERVMYLATNNVNTHKGAIFSLGCFLFSIGYIYPNKDINSLQSSLIDLSKVFNLEHKYINEELANGYPSVFNVGYPIYKESVDNNYSIDEAGVKTLLYIMSKCDDSNIIKRSNTVKAKEIKDNLNQLLSSSIDYISIAELLNRQFINENISAGGSADLLMLSIFIYYFSQKKY